MLSPAEMAAALNTTRSAFSRVFLQAQTDWPAKDRTRFEAVTFASLDRAAFQEAFEFARTRNFLEPLSHLIVGEKLEDGRIAESLASAGQDPALQAMVNAIAGLPQPHIIWRGIADAMRWTCRIQVAGNMEGTGFLVGPNLVLTAWHVVRPLFDVISTAGNKQPLYKARPGLADVLFYFDDYSVPLGPGGPLGPAGRMIAQPADDWYVAHSSCHEDELTHRLPAKLSELDGFWDYCVLRLRSLPGLERRWALLEANAVCPKVNDLVFLFHHPAGQPMRSNTSTVGGFPENQAEAIDLRFLHSMNTLAGSSGGPCFDKNFSLFGIHQGEWQTGQVGANRGVPITRILKHIDRNGGLPLPDPTQVPILTTGEEDLAFPIVGRDSLQTLVWRSVAKGLPRLISIGGTSKSGKTFCTDIVRKMLPDGDHLKIVIEAETIAQQTARDCARTICAGAGAGVSLTEPGEFGSTTGAYQKGAAVQDIFNAIGAVRGTRTVWLIIKELNKFPIRSTEVRDLLLLIYQQTKNYNWFRVVLDGFRGDLPNDVRVGGEYQARHVEQDQIRDFLLRYAASEGIPLQVSEATTNAKVVFAAYDRAVLKRPEDALSELSMDVIDHMIAYQSK